MYNILITGANSYLGSTLVKHFTKHDDFKILAVTRKERKNTSSNDSERVTYLSGIDLLSEESLQVLANVCRERFSGPLHVINCVGYYKGQSPMEATSIKEAREIFESNFTAVYNTAFSLMPYLKENGGGHFMGFSCKSVKFRYPEMAPYSAAKAALECIMGSLANEFSKYGVIANSFSLSTLDTDYERKLKPNGDYANWLKLDDIGNTLCDIIKGNFGLMNGNTIDLFRYSESFFHKSYYERIRK